MQNRIQSVDSVRFVAVVCVVLIHTDPFQGFSAYGNMFNFATKTTGRFAVPFFFVTSGYFFAAKATDRDLTRYFTDRVGTIASYYAFGLALAAPVFFAGSLARARVADQNLADAALATVAAFASPAELLYYGTSVSEVLWFLPALLYSLAFVYAFVRTNRTTYLLPVAFGFHVVGVVGANYELYVTLPFEVRDALFFGAFYTSLGYVVRARDWRPGPTVSGQLLGLTALFYALQFGEMFLMGYAVPGEQFGQSVYAPSYSFATAPLTLSLFLFLLSRPTLGAATPLPRWGKYAVGIYVAHPPVLYVLHGVRDTLAGAGYAVSETILWHLAITPATVFGAVLVYRTAHRLGVIEIGGSHVPRMPDVRRLRADPSRRDDESTRRS